MTKKSWQKLKYPKNEKSFQDEIKRICTIFKGISIKQIMQIILEGESPTLIWFLLWWCHQLKNGSKRSKLIFHVPMLIERWKSKVKVTLGWIIHLWNHKSVYENSKLWSFDSTWWCHQLKFGLKKGPNLNSMY